jgi:hypothetical protein
MNNPEFPEAFASGVVGMGAPRAYFPIKGFNRVGNLVFFFILVGGAALVFLYGVYEAFAASQNYGLAVIDDKLTGPLIIAAIMFGLGLLAGWGAYTNWNKGVAVYERGFAYRDRKGIQPWGWQEMVSLTAAITRHYTNGIYTGTTHVYTLYNRQNQRLILNDAIKKVEGLAKMIQDAIYPLLYDRSSQQYNSGQPVVFGPVAVSKGGIQIGKKTYPWAEVKEVSIHQGILKVSKKDGGWFSGASAAASAIPNLGVLLSIIHQVVGLKAG